MSSPSNAPAKAGKAKATTAKAIRVTQEAPTKPVKRDAQGYALDAYGLPLSGPARLRALDGKPDPRDSLVTGAAGGSDNGADEPGGDAPDNDKGDDAADSAQPGDSKDSN